MATATQTAGWHGTVEPEFALVGDRLGEYVAADPTYAGTLAVYHHGRLVADLWWGPGTRPDELLPVFSSSKGAAGIVVACLVRDGLVDLDAPVASLWPAFAAGGKAAVPVRQLLSHQAGLLGVDGGFTYDELYGHAPLAARLAAQRPHWVPGSAHAYHALTIGVLADELALRATGERLGAYLRAHVTGARGLDVYLGTPESEDGRVVAVELPTAEELAAWPDGVAVARPGSIGWLALPDDQPNLLVECNSVRFRRVGTPAGGGLANGRGLAGLYASIHHEISGVARLLDAETVGAVSQQQVWEPELTFPEPSAFAVIFQKPTDRLGFGSYRAFGHDGAGGSLAFCDPHFDVAFGYTVHRIPLPGGADERALRLSRDVRRCCVAADGGTPRAAW
ncbi:MAG TPA: serine hydrolase domain-containing protein [Acidimicrobiales bacterium]|jgi:CubicO group peptidase (beta-lactamase class C family)